MIACDRLFEPFRHGTTSFSHGYTFGGHPVSAAVAMANLDIFEREGLNDHVRENAPAFRASLETLLDLPIVGDVRGEGYFYGIELVKDKADPGDVRRRPRRSGCCADTSPRRCSTPGSTAAPTTAATRSSSCRRR